MGRIINRSQSGFLKDRNIMDGILALHEILHDTRVRKKMVSSSNLILKSLRLSFLLSQAKGFL
jgi:hypothetical protein